MATDSNRRWRRLVRTCGWRVGRAQDQQYGSRQSDLVSAAPQARWHDRAAGLTVPAAAALLLWPAVWNGYPIVFADTGTYLSQGIHHYAGWDRPVFYSLFMLPLHLTITLWPVVIVQALLTVWILRLLCRTLVPRLSEPAFLAGTAALSALTWLPWLVSELMPDLFTPLLILTLCLLAEARLSRRERIALTILATFMIATQQSSLPLAAALTGVLLLRSSFRRRTAPSDGVGPPSAKQHAFRGWTGWRTPFSPHARGHRARHRLTSWRNPLALRLAACRPSVVGRGNDLDCARAEYHSRRLSLLIPLPVAILALCSVNLVAHHRFAISPYGNIFLLARVLYDGPGMDALNRECPQSRWRLCPYRNQLPPTSDDFLWTNDSPLNRAGGPKAVSSEADAIIGAALRVDPLGEMHAAIVNTVRQLLGFRSGDGLTPWAAQVSPWIERDFPLREVAAYAGARQQSGTLSVPSVLASLHAALALSGTAVCALILPVALRRRVPAATFLLAGLLAIPLSAAITGALSAPHDRYQSRIMWLPPLIAVVSVAGLGTATLGRAETRHQAAGVTSIDR